MQDIFSQLDLVFFDLKHMDPQTHKALTGVPNDVILDNARKISDLGVPVVLRVPLIPGRNDSESNMDQMAEYAKTLKSLVAVELLPYHPYGRPKYKRLGLTYRLLEVSPPQRAYVEALKSRIAGYGIKCNYH